MEIFTQERLDEIQTAMLADPQWRNVAGCKACGGYVQIGDWLTTSGDHYGKQCCGAMLRSVRAGAKPVPAADPAAVKALRAERANRVPELLFKVRLTNGWALMVHALHVTSAEHAANLWLTARDFGNGYAKVGIDAIWPGRPEEVTEHGMLIRA